MGRLIYIARMRGLEPPYALRPEEIVKLPAPRGGGRVSVPAPS